MSRCADQRVRGSVTVEAAMVIPLLMVVMVACLAGVAYLATQLRCIDAAREAARLFARGDETAATTAAHQLAGNVSVDMRVEGGVVRVSVTAQPFAGVLPGVRIQASALAAVEGHP